LQDAETAISASFFSTIAVGVGLWLAALPVHQQAFGPL
jgi:hypothetical protein